MFQCMANELFGDMHFVHVHIDNVVFLSEALDDHLEHIIVVWKRIWEAGPNLKQENGFIAVLEVDVLAHTVPGDVVETDHNWLEKILHARILQFKKRLAFFFVVLLILLNVFKMGLSQPKRPYSGLQHIMCSMAELRKRMEQFPCWRSVYQARHYFHSQEPKYFRCVCGHPQNAVGASLVQKEPNSNLHQVQSATRPLKMVKWKLSSLEQEAAAGISSLHTFRHYHFSASISIHSKHEALRAAFSKDDAYCRLKLWLNCPA